VEGHYRISVQGGPEVLEWHSRPVETLSPNQVLVQHTAIGLNYLDVYHGQDLLARARPLFSLQFHSHSPEA